MSGRVGFPQFWVVFTLALAVALSDPAGFCGQSAAISEASKARALELDRQGQKSIAAKQFEQAKVLFKNAIQCDPRLTDPRENLALVLLLQGEDAASERVATELLALSPSNYNARLVAGVAAINLNHFRQGRDYLAPVIKSGASDPLVSAANAIAVEQTENDVRGAHLRDGATPARVDAADALLAGQIFRQADLRTIARKWLEASVADQETGPNPQLLYMLAGLYVDDGKSAEACTLYEKILETDPQNLDALLGLSEAERMLGQKEKSDSHLYAAKTLSITDTLSLAHLADVLMRLRMYVDAKGALEKVIAGDSSNEHAWYQLGLAQFRIGEGVAAEKDFKSSLDLDKDDSWSRVGLGAVLMSEGRQGEAAVEFQRVLKQNPRNPAAHYYLARIDRIEGKTPLALRELQQAINVAGKDARPWAELGQLQMEQKQYALARKSLSKAIQIDPGYALAHYYLAMVLKRSGDQAEAEKEANLFKERHDEETKNGIVGLVAEGKWDYAGFLPAN